MYIVQTHFLLKGLQCYKHTATIALSCTIFELFDVEQYRDLEI